MNMIPKHFALEKLMISCKEAIRVPVTAERKLKTPIEQGSMYCTSKVDVNLLTRRVETHSTCLSNFADPLYVSPKLKVVQHTLKGITLPLFTPD